MENLKPRRKMFVVISYDDDQQQLFFDTVPAVTETEAGMKIAVLRDYAAVAAVMPRTEFYYLAGSLEDVSVRDADKTLASMAAEKQHNIAGVKKC